jgi:hypothetical protein
MVIHDGDLGRTGIRPSEHDAPLVVDADGMESRKIAFERFESVAGRHLEVIQCAGLVHLNEFPQSHAGDGGETTITLRPKQFLRIPV